MNKNPVGIWGLIKGKTVSELGARGPKLPKCWDLLISEQSRTSRARETRLDSFISFHILSNFHKNTNRLYSHHLPLNPSPICPTIQFDSWIVSCTIFCFCVVIKSSLNTNWILFFLHPPNTKNNNSTWALTASFPIHYVICPHNNPSSHDNSHFTEETEGSERSLTVPQLLTGRVGTQPETCESILLTSI